jgi:hypothetical protein
MCIEEIFQRNCSVIIARTFIHIIGQIATFAVLEAGGVIYIIIGIEHITTFRINVMWHTIERN